MIYLTSHNFTFIQPLEIFISLYLQRLKMSKENLEQKTAKYMRAKQLALHLGIGLSTIWLYTRQGKITAKKISERVTLFDVVEVEKALLGGE